MAALNALLDAVTVMHQPEHLSDSLPASMNVATLLPPVQKLSPIFPAVSSQQHPIHNQHIQLPSISEMFKEYASPPGTPSLQSPFVLQSSRRTSIVSVSYQQSQVQNHNNQSQSTSPIIGYPSTALPSSVSLHATYQFPKPVTAFAKQPPSYISDIPRPVSPLNPHRMNMTHAHIGHHQPHYQQLQRQHPYVQQTQHQFQQHISPSAPPIPEADCETNSTSGESLQQQQQQRLGKYVCTMPNCVKTFKRKHHLESHLVTHSPNKPFCCLEPGCGAAYRRAQELRRHMRIVTH
ncbi:hypothetical protein BJ741DRAFT_614649 [Chytriomyces cf. hyalinus JEL632]|nr:hypothetical protein BJ741DRAFT_614649 [Chytriomyces cf. hyalinus JEL632]